MSAENTENTENTENEEKGKSAKNGGKDSREYLNFPLADATFLVAEVLQRITDKYDETTPKSARELMSELELVDVEIPLPVPLTQEMIDVTNEIEDEILRTGVLQIGQGILKIEFSCAHCRERQLSGGSDTDSNLTCPGILKTGDLLKCILSAALSLGMKTIFKDIAKHFRGLQEGFQPSSPSGYSGLGDHIGYDVRVISAEELFAQLASGIVDRR